MVTSAFGSPAHPAQQPALSRRVVSGRALGSGKESVGRFGGDGSFRQAGVDFFEVVVVITV
ncbi:MAG: hypothetical protein JWP48_1703 [Actinoallomurus sp.]|jgi:hypothetical protein|nr:hypothetical protein [Actinoallomurus sp.]